MSTYANEMVACGYKCHSLWGRLSVPGNQARRKGREGQEFGYEVLPCHSVGQASGMEEKY